MIADDPHDPARPGPVAGHEPAWRTAMGDATIRERARDELRSYALVAGYLYVCFAAIMLYKSALLREAGVGFLPHGIAAAKALILGKFILLGEAAGVGTRLRSTRTLIHAIAVKSLLFFLFLILLSVAEEFLVGRMRGHSFAQTLAEYHEHSVLELLATSLLVLLTLIPLIAVREFSEALGPGGLWKLVLRGGKRSA
jgi:hypothetical protein